MCAIAIAIAATFVYVSQGISGASAAATPDAGSLYLNNQGKTFGQYASVQRFATGVSPDFAFTQNRPFTLEAMIKPRSTISDGELSIFDFRTDNTHNTSQARLVVISADSGVTGKLVIWNTATGIANATGNPVTFNQWNHVAAVYDGAGNVKLYVNGVLQNSSSWSPNPKVDVFLTIGGDTDRYFDGWINDIRVWNGVARTQAQIAANMTSEIDPASTGLVAYYPLDDGSGTSVADATGRGNTATTTNSPTWAAISTSIDNYSAACSPTQSTVSGEYVQTFTGAGSCSWTVPAGVSSVRALVVGGGGGGGADNGGGGGAGGYVAEPSFAVTSGTDIDVWVGAGGFGGPATYNPGFTGGQSRFGSLVARGGGGGGSIDNTPGLDGGSAGGRAANRAGTALSAIATTSPLQGNNGGAKGTGFGGGGGGGASVAGASGGGGTGGAGGAGASNDITGTPTYYAGGGGGGGNNAAAGVGGIGGGGAGSTIGNVNPTAGTDNRGGGGGGAGGAVAGGLGARGGSGIVIIRYVVVPVTTTTSTTTSTTSTTTTTVASSQTTSPATTVAASGSTSTGGGGSGSTSTTVVKKSLPLISTSIPATSSTTVVPADTSTAPEAPAADVGAAAISVGDKSINAEISRSDNRLIVSASTITAKLWVEDSEHARRALDADGNIRLLSGDSVFYEIAGLAAGSDASLWLFSTPINLGVMTADSMGVVSGSVPLPATAPVGNHRLVVDSTNAENAHTVLSVGIAVGKIVKSSSNTRTLAIISLVLAVGAALLLPTVARRRRRA